MAKTRTGLRVMVDANILIAGSVWPRWPYEVIQHALHGDFQLILSPYILGQAVKQLNMRFPESTWRLEHLLETSRYELARNPTKGQVVQAVGLTRDETDLPVVLAAIAAKVDYLVSEDKDLTAQDGTTEELHKRLKVLISGTFLREVMGWNSDELERVRKRTWQDLPAPDKA